MTDHTPDKAEILKTFKLMYRPMDIIETRIIYKGGRKRIDAGYVDKDNRGQLAEYLVKKNPIGNVYITLNQIDPQLHSRYCNRIQEYAESTATDANIIWRDWLLIDADPVRPKDTSSTDDQLQAAMAVIDKIQVDLSIKGFPDPVRCLSGNGGHLLYKIDMPNDASSTELIKNFLVYLAKTYDTPKVTIDKSVFNAGRITKLYGTVAKKGDHTATAPHRLSRILSIGKAIKAVAPTYDMVFVADNDRLQAGNPGVTKATAAALATGARLAIPTFPGDEGTDVCDLCRVSGDDAVKACLQQSRQIEPIDEPAPDAETATEPPGAWPEPHPIESQIEPQDYPLDALPDTIRFAVEEVLGFVKAPTPLVVSAALSGLSMAVQSHADVVRAEKLKGPTGLYLLTIAESGERKSTCDNFFTSAIRDYEAKQAEAAKPAIKEYKAKFDSWDQQYSGVKDSIRAAAKAGKSTIELDAELLQLQMDEPEPPRIPRIIYGDATPAALKYNLAKGWPSGAVVSSEGGIVFGGHGMKKDSAMENLATLNQLWDGTDQPTERRATESYTVKGARFTMSIMVQEATLRAFFKQDGGLARGTGFLARFLIAWPESTQGFRPFTEAPANWPHIAAFNRRISAILSQEPPIDDDGALHPQMMTLSPEAKQAWVAFHDAIESELGTGGELFDIRDVASKTADNAARLACQFHVFSGDAGAISLDAFEAASRITAWHLNEARRFFGGLALPQELADAARLDDWMLDHCRRHKTGTIPVRTIQQFGPCGLRSKVAIDAAMEELESLERSRRVKDGKRKIILINPVLLRGEK